MFVDAKEGVKKGCSAAIWQNDFDFLKISKPGVIDLKLKFRTFVSKVYFKLTAFERDQNPSKRFFRKIGKLPKIKVSSFKRKH